MTRVPLTHADRHAHSVGPIAAFAFALAVALAAAGAAHAQAQALALAVEQQALILSRALAYDRDLPLGSGGTVDIAVVAETAADAKRAMSAFRALEKKTLAGLPVRVHFLPLVASESLRARLAGIDALYVHDGVTDLDLIVSSARAAGVTTLGGQRSFVERGVSIGVYLAGDRPTILVNLAAAKAEGASFSSELFKIAQPLR